MAVNYLSLCSGIEAASVAWSPLGWRASGFSEIEPFPSAVLKHHYPTVPNFGDMTRFQEWPDLEPDCLVGGTPCQSFSVAGLRGGLDDPRGELMLVYGAIARRYRPRWLVWENVPGVLSSNGGRDFGTFLGMLAELGYGFAYRVLDAQFFGVAQRRRRVFVVGHLGDWRRAAAVLFERESLSGHPAPRREAGKAAPTIPSRSTAGGSLGTDFDCDGGLIPSPHTDLSPALKARDSKGPSSDGDGDGAILVPMVAHSLRAQAQMAHREDQDTLVVAHSLRGEGFDASEDGTGRGTPLVPVQPYTLAIRGRGDSYELEYRQDGTANALLTPNGGRGGIGVGAVAFNWQGGGTQTSLGYDPDAGVTGSLHVGQTPAVAFDAYNQSLSSDGAVQTMSGCAAHNRTPQAMIGMAVRRLTPRECARLQGFPDDYLDITYRNRPAADGPKYRALGNSMAVPVMRWIGQRIGAVMECQP